MTEEEKRFKESVINKIRKYDIKKKIPDPSNSKKEIMVPVTFKDCLIRARNKFVETVYNDGSKELIDIGIEKYLYQCSPYLFIDKNCFIELPGYGRMPASALYYYQKMILKDYDTITKKYVFTKTRQCLTEDNYVMTDRGYISIKEVKVGDLIQTSNKRGKCSWTRVLDWIDQGEKEICEIVSKNHSIRCTYDHKILTSKGWKESKDITLKDWIVCKNGRERVESVIYTNSIERVYDITTGTHDFLANGVVVHNCGMSTLSSLIFFWKAVCFGSQEEVIISKDGDSAQDVLKKIKDNLDCIPKWFGLDIVINNVKSVSFSNGSKIKSLARSPTAGRGGSPTLVLLDEAAFYQTDSIIQGIVASVQASLTRTGGQLFVVSTPAGSAKGTPGYWYYKQVHDLKDAGGKTSIAKLTDISWWEVLDIEGIAPYKGYNSKVQTFIDRDYARNPEVKAEAEKFFAPITKDWKSNDWLKYQYETLGKVLFEQEILKNFVVMGNTVFTDEIIQRVKMKMQVPVISDDCSGKHIKGFWQFKKPEPDHKYIIGADVSKGSANDESCIQVIDMHTYEQVGEYLGKCTTIDLANYIYNIGMYYNMGYVVLECNSIGEAVFNELYYNLNYPNLYKQRRNKAGVDIMTGWMTTQKSRELITNNFIEYYYDDETWKIFKPHSERLVSQMMNWVWSGGRPDHTSGEHDDAIMAMAIALFNIAEGIKKIRKPEDALFYDESGVGINTLDRNDDTYTKKYLSSVIDTNKELPESVYKEAEKKMYKNAGIPETENQADTYRWLLGR